jgi:hypothetical protein
MTPIFKRKQGARAKYQERQGRRVKEALTLCEEFPRLKSLTVNVRYLDSDSSDSSHPLKFAVNVQHANPGGTMSTMTQIVHQLHAQRKRAELELERLNLAIKALGGIRVKGNTTRRKPQFTKAGLARIAAAQRARWAKIKAGKKK